MHLGSGSVSCVPCSKDYLFYGRAALMPATSTTARRKFSLILTDKETGILQNKVSCQVDFLQMCMHIFSFLCRGHVREHYISPNHFLNFTANQNGTGRQRMNAEPTDKFVPYSPRLQKSEILVLAQCSQILCSFPCPVMFNSLAQMLTECQKNCLGVSPLSTGEL